MATTTNYGWTTPDDTSLVKDGASAIRTLGSSVDTTVKGLSPGTTAGDIDYYTSSTAKARIGIGTNGQVLTSNGSVPSWATPSSGSMTQIATGTVASTSVVLSSISQLYRHLYLVVTSAQLSSSTDLAWRFNADTGTNYSVAGVKMNNTAVVIRNTDTLMYANSGSQPLCPTTANNDTYTLFIQNYTTSKVKPISISAISATAKADATYGFGNWVNTAAITSITLCTNAGTATFSVGTYTLFGVN
jgi:hypothetical protein